MRVAIIGGGPSGLITAKYMLENNIKPFIFEKLKNIGGMWNINNTRSWGDDDSCNEEEEYKKMRNVFFINQNYCKMKRFRKITKIIK